MKLRVFMIEDEACIRESIQWHLEEQGHQVIANSEPLICDIYNGCDCSSPYPCGDLLFIDQWLPKVTGLEFIRRMKERGCKGEPFRKYIMTGNAAMIDMNEVERVGCNVLQKPVPLAEIDKIITETIKKTDPDRKLNNLNGLLEDIAS